MGPRKRRALIHLQKRIELALNWLPLTSSELLVAREMLPKITEWSPEAIGSVKWFVKCLEKAASIDSKVEPKQRAHVSAFLALIEGLLVDLQDGNGQAKDLQR